MTGPPLISGRGVDVSDAKAVSDLVDRVVAIHGKIDIVFANAGIARGRPPLLPEGWLDDMDMAAYNALIDVNLHGVVYTVQAAARHMKRQRSGSIVTTASTAGMRNDPYTPYSYAIAKAAVVNFTKQAAHDLARWGVRVNAIAPGPFKTHLGSANRTARPGRRSRASPDRREQRGHVEARSSRWAGWATRQRSAASPCSSPPTRAAS